MSQTSPQLPYVVGCFVNSGPATPDEAGVALRSLGWTVVEAEDSQQGIWLAVVDPATRATVEAEGHYEAHVGNVDIFIETP